MFLDFQRVIKKILTKLSRSLTGQISLTAAYVR